MNLTFVEYFFKGGIVMYPLLMCSIISLAVILNKIVVFFVLRVDDIKGSGTVLKLISQGKHEDALVIALSKKNFITDFLAAGLKQLDKGRVIVEEVFEEQALIIIRKLEKYLPILSIIASVATLIGFTGTVLGMIRAFNSIAAHGVSSPTIVASGIAEALITTATGLIVAVPTLVAYHYFVYRVDNYIYSIEQISIEFIKSVFGNHEV